MPWSGVGDVPMVESPGVRVPRSEAETTRRRLLELDALRLDLEVAQVDGDVVFPVAEACGARLPTVGFSFKPRDVRPAGYQELLPADLRASAPRAFDQMGDIVIVKIPPELASRAAEIGLALLRFHKARAVFLDHGVKDPYRTRDVERIAGAGGSMTQVVENGVRLWVDPAKAYFSPRLATERSRVANLVRPGEHFVDLFGGVAGFGLQAALRGAVVDSIDLNPEAIALAKRNVGENRAGERVSLHLGDARAVASRLAAADRIVMNLPHGAGQFLDVAAGLLKPGAMLHYHEILEPQRVDERAQEVARDLSSRGKPARLVSHRIVRNYSPIEAHVAFDFSIEPAQPSRAARSSR
jgi:tRNA (guanine37-N1)-methyltransferase